MKFVSRTMNRNVGIGTIHIVKEVVHFSWRPVAFLRSVTETESAPGAAETARGLAHEVEAPWTSRTLPTLRLP